MAALHLAALFFAGAFLINASPHLTTGVTGRAFQSPFAKPPGQGLSSSTINVLWAFANLAIAYVLLIPAGHFAAASAADVSVLGLGGLLSGLAMARVFGRFHGGNAPGKD
jgi:hypothetical protein